MPLLSVQYFVLFSVVFAFTMWLLDGFRISSLRIHELIFVSSLSVFLSDLFFTLIHALFNHHLVPLWEAAAIFGVQIFCCVIYGFFSNRMFCLLTTPQKTLVICGNFREAAAYIGKVRQFKHRFQVQGIISPDEQDLYQKIDQFDAIHLVFLLPAIRVRINEYCARHNKDIYIVPSLNEILLNRADRLQISDTIVLEENGLYLSTFQAHIKRFFDIVLSALGLMIASPIVGIAAIAIKKEDHGLVLFKQERVTQFHRPFTLYKLRTMIPDAEAKHGAMLSPKGDPRITKVGKILRAARIDEIPQLWNVLKGDMSLVGPRPERAVLGKQYESDFPLFRYRLNVPGGLTGFAQVYGKYNTHPQDKLMMDLYYISNYSLLLDFKILFLTVKTVFTKEATEGVDVQGINWYSFQPEAEAAASENHVAI